MNTDNKISLQDFLEGFNTFTETEYRPKNLEEFEKAVSNIICDYGWNTEDCVVASFDKENKDIQEFDAPCEKEIKELFRFLIE